MSREAYIERSQKLEGGSWKAEESRSDQSQCSVFSGQCHPERSRRVSYAVISTTMEERSVGEELEVTCPACLSRRGRQKLEDRRKCSVISVQYSKSHEPQATSCKPSSAPKGRQASAQVVGLCWECTTTLAPATARLYRVEHKTAGRTIPHDTSVRQQRNNSMIYMDKSTMAMDSSIISMDKSTKAVDHSMMSMDSSTITMDSSMISMDKSTVAMDKSLMSMDSSTITMDSSMISVDKSIMYVDKSTIAMDHSITTMDSSRRQPTCPVISRTGESLQSQVAVCHPERSRRVPYHLISRLAIPMEDDQNEERSVTAEQYCNRFLSHTSFEMTGNRKLEAQKKLTIKYNNSPSRRVRSTQKTSHLSALQLAGARELKTNGHGHSPEHSNVLSFVRGGARRAEGYTVLFANNLIQSMPMKHD